jgi:2-C-methyl-D-erythritol 4-phosphate cytidylyltransferase
LPSETIAVILAAGRGERLGEDGPPEGKAFLPILGEPMLRWSARALDACPEIASIVIVAPPGEEARARSILGEGLSKVRRVVAGGLERQDSLGAGLDALAELAQGDPLVAVHDAARALLRSGDAGRTVIAAERWGAAILAVPVKDTIKIVEKDAWIQATPERARLWIAQTPQVARASLLRRALGEFRAAGRVSTDEAGLLEGIGVAVRVVLGDYTNIKITTPDDVLLAEAILASRRAGAEGGA